MNIFADIWMLTKQLKAALTSNRNIYNSIANVIAFDSIYNDFETKMLSFFKTNNKTIDKIQQILCFAKAKNSNKQATNVTNNLAMLFRGSQRGYNNYLKGKQKANSNK